MEMYSSYIQAAILGLIQGFTEFLPISSTGHLVIGRDLLGWPDQGLEFDMVMHFATLFAVLIYFWSDWKEFHMALVSKSKTKSSLEHRLLLKYILIATIPAILGALLMKDIAEGIARETVYVAAALIIVGILFIVVEKVARPRRNLNKVTIWDTISVGIAQAAAVIPGVSRSGATISAGIYQGLKRDQAAKFSFLIGAPTILMAGGYSLLHVISSPPADLDITVLLIAFATAFISGYIAIKFMLDFLKTHSLIPFAIYRIILGAILIGINIFHVRLPWLS